MDLMENQRLINKLHLRCVLHPKELTNVDSLRRAKQDNFKQLARIYENISLQGRLSRYNSLHGNIRKKTQNKFATR